MHTSQVASEIFRNSDDYRTMKLIFFTAKVLGMYLNSLHCLMCVYTRVLRVCCIWHFGTYSLNNATCSGFTAALCIGQVRDCQQGAATTLNAAVHPELNKEEFEYYTDCRPAQQTRDAR